MARKQNPPLLKIDKLVYSHAVSCLISELTNHKLKVSGFSCNTPLLLHHLLSGWSCDCAQAGIQISADGAALAWKEKCIQLDADRLASDISSRVVLKLPSTQTFCCKTLLKSNTGEASIAVVEGQFRAPPPKIGRCGPAISATTGYYCCKTAQTVALQARENGARSSAAASRHLLAISHKPTVGAEVFRDKHLWEQDLLR